MNLNLIIVLTISFSIIIGLILYFTLKTNNNIPADTSCYNNCNNHGKCNGGVCTCDPGYTGNYCSIKCPDQCTSPSGTCDYKGSCVCNPGYTGPNCSQKTCPNNCNNPFGGYCEDNVCKCNIGYIGIDCSQKTCNPPCNTIGGKCNTNTVACDCNPGYSGYDCSTCEPPLSTNGAGGCKVSFDTNINICYLTFSDIIVNNKQYYIDPNNKTTNIFQYKYTVSASIQKFNQTPETTNTTIMFNDILTQKSFYSPFFYSDSSKKDQLLLNMKLRSNTQTQLPIIFDLTTPQSPTVIGTASFTLTQPPVL